MKLLYIVKIKYGNHYEIVAETTKREYAENIAKKYIGLKPLITTKELV